jgi:hypothetical protein
MRWIVLNAHEYSHTAFLNHETSLLLKLHKNTSKNQSRFPAGEAKEFVKPVIGPQNGLSLGQGLALGLGLSSIKERSGMNTGIIAVLLAEKPFCQTSGQGGKSGNQFILQPDKGHRGTGIPLPGRAAKELPIHPPGLMAFRGQDKQSTKIGDVPAKFNIGAPPGHIRGNGNFPRLAGSGHDLGLFGVPNGI